MYRKISIPTDLIEKVEIIIKKVGRYRSIAEFVSESIRLRLDALNIRLPDGFVEWARRKGISERIERGETDIVEALKEWQEERLHAE